MSDKALLVMDMPENCEECPFCGFGDYTCRAFEILGKNYTHVVPEDGVADWCPLKPIPEKKIKCEFTSCSKKCCEHGWNACIDKVLEGEE